MDIILKLMTLDCFIFVLFSSIVILVVLVKH